MELHTVASRGQLAAAVANAAFDKHSDARAHPFAVELAGTRFCLTFPHGLTVRRAEQLCAEIRKTPASAFVPH